MGTTFRKRKTRDCLGSAFSINGGPKMKEGLAGAGMIEEHLSEMNAESRYKPPQTCNNKKDHLTKRLTIKNLIGKYIYDCEKA